MVTKNSRHGSVLVRGGSMVMEDAEMKEEKERDATAGLERKRKSSEAEFVQQRKRMVCSGRGTPGGCSAVTPLRTLFEVEDALSRQADASLLSVYNGGGAGQIMYLSGVDAISLANKVFGFDGWSATKVSEGPVNSAQPSNGRCTVYWRMEVQVRLAPHLGGGFRTGDGFGKGTEATADAAVEKAVKEAYTDALKRALMLFGYVFGCFKDKAFLTWAAKQKRQQPGRQFFTERAVNPWENKSSVVVRSAAPKLGEGTARVADVKEEDEYGDIWSEDE
jgi:DNA recombination protein Rad52